MVRADILIVGQGLAGTLLAWECERAGWSFAIVDAGHDGAATLAAAGIINPVTGRRLVKSWRVDALLPEARRTYRELEEALGLPLWRDMRVRRLFADDSERRALARKAGTGELAPFVTPEASDAEGFWIEGAGRVDLPALVTAARQRWVAQGRLTVGRVEPRAEAGKHRWVIDCTGKAAALAGVGQVPWEFSKGEMLRLQIPLDPGVIVNRRQWVLPVGPEAAWVGATHEPGERDPQPTPAGRARLEGCAAELLGYVPPITEHRAGVRVYVPDKHAVAGVLDQAAGLGCVNALGSKGALLAPALAAAWRALIATGQAFDPALQCGRFAR